MKRVLVAGATGYLGRFVVQELKSRGHFVRALARSPEKLADLHHCIDETFIGEVTQPETLAHVCDAVDVVFSSLGITKQKDGLTFRDVDYQGNKNLLDLALGAGVKRFVYVSVRHGPELRQLEIVDAHEAFVDQLTRSGIEHTVVRPTGYFSDMSEFLNMAHKGRVLLVGDGQHRCNPIHGADLAAVCADAMEGGSSEINVGGPQVMSYREIAQLAVDAAGGAARISRVPVWVMKASARLTRLFNHHQGALFAFFTAMMTRDVVAPTTGARTLEQYFCECSTNRVEPSLAPGAPRRSGDMEPPVSKGRHAFGD